MKSNNSNYWIAYLLGVIIVWTVTTILALTSGLVYDWPDNYHINYGFPFVWSTHTLSSITGTVDLWQVNLLALQGNLILWLGTMIVAAALLMIVVNRKK